MYSIAFPDIFSPSRTKLFKDREATSSNLNLILNTLTRNCLYGDPYYGTNLLAILYEQNSAFLEDLVKDEIYSAVLQYIPQLKLDRKNIEVYFEGSKLFTKFTAVNLIDQKLDLYTIELTDFSQTT